MKIRSVRAELFRVDGQTGVTRLVVALRKFANPPKIEWYTRELRKNFSQKKKIS
jgi:hypothetical protein